MIVNYETVLEQMEPEDYAAVFQAAYDYNAALREVEFPFRDYENVPGYYNTLKVDGTSIIGYVKIRWGLCTTTTIHICKIFTIRYLNTVGTGFT